MSSVQCIHSTATGSRVQQEVGFEVVRESGRHALRSPAALAPHACCNAIFPAREKRLGRCRQPHPRAHSHPSLSTSQGLQQRRRPRRAPQRLRAAAGPAAPPAGVGVVRTRGGWSAQALLTMPPQRHGPVPTTAPAPSAGERAPTLCATACFTNSACMSSALAVETANGRKGTASSDRLAARRMPGLRQGGAGRRA